LDEWFYDVEAESNFGIGSKRDVVKLKAKSF
jgi:hypothetical protein